MDIERLATSIIVSSISKTEQLSSNINDGDKEPSWDGHIYVYNSKEQKQSNMAGRVPVQVKGTTTVKPSKNKIAFPIRATDLNNYLVEGGTIYFVVCIDENGDGDIYYVNLLPFVINRLFNNSNAKTSISVNLLPFPTSSIGMTNIFLNFIEDKKKQASSLDKNIFSLKDVPKLGEIEGFSFGYKGIGCDRSNPLQYLFENGAYIYAKPKGFNVKIPVDYISKLESASTNVENPVCIGGKQFFNSFKLLHKVDRDEIHIGQGIILTFFKDNDNNMRFDYNLTGSLLERISAGKFMISLLEKKELYIGEIPILGLSSFKDFEGFKGTELIELKKQLENLDDVQNLLELLKVKVDFELDNLSENDENTLTALIRAFVYNEPIGFEGEPEIPYVSKVGITNLDLLLVFKKRDDGKFNITNFFDERLEFSIMDEDDKSIIVSQYIYLTKENFLELSNIDYDTIIESLSFFPDSEIYHHHVNFLLLRMLSAFDEKTSNNSELLLNIIRIAEWQCTKSDSFPQQLAILNHLQSIRRLRDLKDCEMAELCKIIEQVNQSEEVLIGAYLLMDNQKAAKNHFLKLSEEEKEMFKLYPIYKFWKE